MRRARSVARSRALKRESEERAPLFEERFSRSGGGALMTPTVATNGSGSSGLSLEKTKDLFAAVFTE